MPAPLACLRPLIGKTKDACQAFRTLYYWFRSSITHVDTQPRACVCCGCALRSKRIDTWPCRLRTPWVPSVSRCGCRVANRSFRFWANVPLDLRKIEADGRWHERNLLAPHAPRPATPRLQVIQLQLQLSLLVLHLVVEVNVVWARCCRTLTAAQARGGDKCWRQGATRVTDNCL